MAQAKKKPQQSVVATKKPVKQLQEMAARAGEMMQNAAETAKVQAVTEFQNSLSQALLGFPISALSQGSVQVSQTDTLMKNLRWYLVSTNRALLNQLYVENGLVRTICDLPVDDAFRGEINFSSKQLTASQLDDLQAYWEQENLIDGPAQTAKWNRLFGGSGLIPFMDDDYSEPFNINAINQQTTIDWRSVDLWELNGNTVTSDDMIMQASPEVVKSMLADFDYFNYYGKKIHRSRVRTMRGIRPPSLVRPMFRGWGMSEVEALVRSINQFLKSNNLAFEVLDEFKVDIFQFDGLTQTLLSGDGQARVQARVRTANTQKSYLNSIVLDAKDKYDSKQLTFTGLSEVMKEIRINVASEMRFPLTKLFGISSSGFNSGEDDIENYNGMVTSSVRRPGKREILFVAAVTCQKLFGKVPTDLGMTYPSLRMMTSTDEETVKSAKHSRMLMTWQAGGMETKEFKEGCNKDKLLSVQLDPNVEMLDMGQGDDGGEGGEGAGKAVKSKEPGKDTDPKTPKSGDAKDDKPETGAAKKPKEGSE